MLQAAVVLTLLAGGLTWWMLRRELAPTRRHPHPDRTLRHQAAASAAAQREPRRDRRPSPKAQPPAGHARRARTGAAGDAELPAGADGGRALAALLQGRERRLYRLQQGLRTVSRDQPRTRSTRRYADIAPPDLAARYDAAEGRELLGNPVCRPTRRRSPTPTARATIIFHKATFNDVPMAVSPELIGVLLDITERKVAGSAQVPRLLRP